MNAPTSHKQPSQRQLRVGEELRHILASIILRNDWPSGETLSPLTVTRVDMSPDLQNALVFFMPLGGEKQEETLLFLKENVGYLRKMMGKNITLRRVPMLRFVLDDTFEKAERMERLFKSVQPC